MVNDIQFLLKHFFHSFSLVPPSFTRQRTMSLHLGQKRRDLQLDTITNFARLGIQAIIDDDVTKRFAAKELQTWNLLTRTDKVYHYKSLRLFLIWMVGLIFRFLILLPMRFIITVVSLTSLIFIMALIGLIPESNTGSHSNLFY